MTGTIKVIPAAGARVVQPERLHAAIPPEGASVPDNSYYRRFILNGDLSEVADLPAQPVASAGPEAEADPPRFRRASKPSPTSSEQE